MSCNYFNPGAAKAAPGAFFHFVAFSAVSTSPMSPRTVYAEVPPRVEYELTELGETLRPVLRSLQAWGTEYQERAAK